MDLNKGARYSLYVLDVYFDAGDAHGAVLQRRKVITWADFAVVFYVVGKCIINQPTSTKFMAELPFSARTSFLSTVRLVFVVLATLPFRLAQT